MHVYLNLFLCLTHGIYVHLNFLLIQLEKNSLFLLKYR